MPNWKPLHCAMIISLLTTLLGTPTQVLADSSDEQSIQYAFPHPVILIDAGHGGIDGGTSSGTLLEKDINLEIGKRLYMVLRSHGYTAILNRSGDYALSDDNRWLKSRSRHLRDLAQRKELSEQVPASIVISLHVNWGRNSARRGPLVLHQDEGQSAMLAFALQQALEDTYQLNMRRLPELGNPFYLLKHTDPPAVIVETGFISNPEDRSLLSSPRGQQRIAEALYSGIAAYFTVM